MKTYPFGPSFMNYLAGGTAEVDFSSIQKEIYYLLDEGSSVTDYMGYTAGDDGYNFDFEDSADSLKLRVGDDILTAETLEARERKTTDMVLALPKKEKTSHTITFCSIIKETDRAPNTLSGKSMFLSQILLRFSLPILSD